MAIITNNLSYKEKETLGIKHTKNSFHKSTSIEFIKRVFKRLIPYILISKVDT